MKRRFPGDQHASAGHSVGGPSRPHDPRFNNRGGGGNSNHHPRGGRFSGPGGARGGGRGPLHNSLPNNRGGGGGGGGHGHIGMPGRGPPMHGRGGPPPRGPRGMGRSGPHHPNMMMRGHNNNHNNNNNHNSNNLMMRGGPGRHSMMGRGGPSGPPMPSRLPPPPPPRAPPMGHGVRMQQHPPTHLLPPPNNLLPPPPPPPIHQPFPNQQQQQLPPQHQQQQPPPPPTQMGISPPQIVHNHTQQIPFGGPQQPPPPRHHQNASNPNLPPSIPQNQFPHNQPPTSIIAPTTTTFPHYQNHQGSGPIPTPSVTPHDQLTAGTGTPVQASVTTYSKEQIDQAWTEHVAPGGTKFYHNSITKESTYFKPDSMVNTEQTQRSTSKVDHKGRIWKEYKDPNTGKIYYSDGATTTWEKPAGYQAESSIDTTEDVNPSPPKKKKKVAPKKESKFNNKQEAIAAFKGLLLAKDIAPTVKWNEVVKICSSDSRWEACEDALTVGERKQALAEYATKRANELRTLERQERIRAKEAFGQLLTEVLPSVSVFSAWNSRFIDVREALSKDDRFYAVEDEDTRESLFLDFCEEFRKRDERKKRNRKREAHDAFLSFLSEREESGTLTHATTWNSFLSSLVESERSDPRFDVSPVMSDSDRQLYFADYVIELQAAEDDKRRRIRDARRRAEKAQRESYREALRRLASEGVIFPSSRWRNVEERIATDDSYNLVHAQDREVPRELFEEFIEEWDELYRRDRSFLSRLVYPSSNKGIVVKLSTSYEDFMRALLDAAAYSPEVYGDTRRVINRIDPVSSARLYYNELIHRVKESSTLAKRRSSSGRRGPQSDSSEDEGEIIEDGEVPENDDNYEYDNDKKDSNDDNWNEKVHKEATKGSSEDGVISVQAAPILQAVTKNENNEQGNEKIHEEATKEISKDGATSKQAAPILQVETKNNNTEQETEAPVVAASNANDDNSEQKDGIETEHAHSPIQPSDGVTASAITKESVELKTVSTEADTTKPEQVPAVNNVPLDPTNDSEEANIEEHKGNAVVPS